MPQHPLLTQPATKLPAGTCAPTSSQTASNAAAPYPVPSPSGAPYAPSYVGATPLASVAAAHASLRSMTFSQVNTSVGSRPKCPYAAVFLYRGRYRSRLRPIMPASAAAAGSALPVLTGARCVDEPLCVQAPEEQKNLQQHLLKSAQVSTMPSKGKRLLAQLKVATCPLVDQL